MEKSSRKISRSFLSTIHCGDDRGGSAQCIIEIQIPVSVPEARVPVITGSVGGVTDDDVSPVGASVFATFDFEGVPVTVSIDSDAVSGVYLIDLLFPGAVDVEAVAGASRSVEVPTTVVGGEVVTEDLTVFPFDAETSNFVPIVLSPPTT